MSYITRDVILSAAQYASSGQHARLQRVRKSFTAVYGHDRRLLRVSVVVHRNPPDVLVREPPTRLKVFRDDNGVPIGIGDDDGVFLRLYDFELGASIVEFDLVAGFEFGNAVRHLTWGESLAIGITTASISAHTDHSWFIANDVIGWRTVRTGQNNIYTYTIFF